jgi:polyvinyl alcohol dehydrogenase (cytochrome)
MARARAGGRRRRMVTLATLLLVAFTAASMTSVQAASPSGTHSRPGNDHGPQWTMWGQNVANTASTTSRISPQNAGRLQPRMVLTTGGDVSARPAVAGNAVYVPDWGGNLYRFDAGTGAVVWQHQISDYVSGLADAISRTSPALDGDTLYLGTQRASTHHPAGSPTSGYLLAVDAATGQLRWKTQLDSHPEATDTASPVVYRGVVYVGVSSTEETLAADPTYQCCTFRGSAVALDARTGAILWKTYMVPAGFSGAAIWGSTPAVDPVRGSLYVTTGNNYHRPPEVQQCIDAGGSPGACNPPENRADSVLSLDLRTGAVKWFLRLSDDDAWNTACLRSGVNCPTNAGPDYDFGSGPNLYTVRTSDGRTRTLLGAGQKSGIYSALNPDDGSLVWATRVGPGGEFGGIEFGTASDDGRIYAAITNVAGEPYVLRPSGEVAHHGSWSALDAATGRILWQVADPNDAIDMGPMTVSNGVVYAPSMAAGPTDDNMYALDARTGTILWRFPSGASVNAGASIVGGTVYWGSGYSKWSQTVHFGSPNNKLYVFTVGGQ